MVRSWFHWHQSKELYLQGLHDEADDLSHWRSSAGNRLGAIEDEPEGSQACSLWYLSAEERHIGLTVMHCIMYVLSFNCQVVHNV